MINRISVFCGSSSGHDPDFLSQAILLGKTLALQGIGIVYGGAKVGLMGAVANGALSENGEVIGVLPIFLAEKEIAHNQLSELILVETMHQRKQLMNDLSDGAITLPGGFGTLEECFELLTWGQLGLHQKPVGLLNINGYYDALIELLQTMYNGGLLKDSNRNQLLVSNSIDNLLQQLQSYRVSNETKWIKK